MANTLLVNVNNTYYVSADTILVEADVANQESGSTNDFGGTSFTVSLKTLGVYNVAVQLNNKILDAAAAFVEDQGHTGLTYAARWLVGGFGQLA